MWDTITLYPKAISLRVSAPVMMILPVLNIEHVISFMSSAGLNLTLTALYLSGWKVVLNTLACEKCSATDIRLRLLLREKLELIMTTRKSFGGSSMFTNFLQIHESWLMIRLQSNKSLAPAIWTLPFEKSLTLFVLTSSHLRVIWL